MAGLVWIIAEIRNSPPLVRLAVGATAAILMAATTASLVGIKAATREHLYRTVVRKLAEEAATGNTNEVCRHLIDYSRKMDLPDDMGAIVELCREFSKEDAKKWQ